MIKYASWKGKDLKINKRINPIYTNVWTTVLTQKSENTKRSGKSVYRIYIMRLL